jgi:hypothetical protein
VNLVCRASYRWNCRQSNIHRIILLLAGPAALSLKCEHDARQEVNKRHIHIMNTVRFPVAKLVNLLNNQKVATMPQLKKALGSSVTFTVLRKLSALGYRSSYSHAGTFYTLETTAQFDEVGLWSHRDIHFSRHGTLLNTAEALVTQSTAGYQVPELEAVVHVAAKDALRQLAQTERLFRREWEGRYLYCAVDRTLRQQQWAARQAQQREGDDLQAAKALFFSLLDEQQRRLYAGLESLQRGHGGQQRTAQLFGVDVDTVARGERELLGGEVLRGRVRQKGGGRVAVEKKRQKS